MQQCNIFTRIFSSHKWNLLYFSMQRNLVLCFFDFPMIFQETEFKFSFIFAWISSGCNFKRSGLFQHCRLPKLLKSTLCESGCTISVNHKLCNNSGNDAALWMQIKSIHLFPHLWHPTYFGICFKDLARDNYCSIVQRNIYYSLVTYRPCCYGD